MELLGQVLNFGMSHSTCGHTSAIISWNAFIIVLTCHTKMPEFQ